MLFEKEAQLLMPECSMTCGKVFSATGLPYENGTIYHKAVYFNGDISFHGRNAYRFDFTMRACILLSAQLNNIKF